MIQLLPKDTTIPYNLLLLADGTVEAIEKYIHQSDIYILKRDNKIIAVYVLQIIGNDSIEIKNLAVDKAFQGQGIGRLLLGDAADRAKSMGFKQIMIGTGDASIKQLYIYQKAGFEVFDIKHRFFLDNYPEPIYENEIQLRHMIMLKKDLE